MQGKGLGEHPPRVATAAAERSYGVCVLLRWYWLDLLPKS